MNKTVLYPLLVLLIPFMILASPQEKPHKFILGKTAFLLDGKPLQIISGELHPSRIPPEYWRHRIRMTAAMGCNCISAYLFWNFHEPVEGQFDFSSPERNVAEFIRLAAAEKIWVLIRPGPYVCAEWDFGGLPPYLLRHPDIRIRCRDTRFMNAVKTYISELANVLKPYQVSTGGPILMLQIENEYGSYGNDRGYLNELSALWRAEGMDIPFYTADGPTPHMLEAGTLAGAAVGLDSGSRDEDFLLASRMRPGVPVFSSETYPGWLTHWGEKWARPGLESLLEEVKYLLENQKSFSFYVVHGGTNFGFTAGANSGGTGYQPDVTSYDYDAPIDEQGRPTAKYHALRKLIKAALPAGRTIPSIPEPVPVMTIPEAIPEVFASLLSHIGHGIPDVQPKPMEMYNQSYGMILYRTELVGRKNGKLKITEPHDYVLVYLDGRYVGKVDRRLGENSIDIPQTESTFPRLDLLVEAMGRINFAQEMIDRKGITERVSLEGMTLMNWRVYPLPLDDAFIAGLSPIPVDGDEGPLFFRTIIPLEKTADTFIDMSAWQKGLVWVNGRNLGRYWNIGPQQRLYCPAPFLKKGTNEILILDLHQRIPAPISGKTTME